jgi:polyhydroxyalkanoate synthesis regulator phasin
MSHTYEQANWAERQGDRYALTAYTSGNTLFNHLIYSTGGCTMKIETETKVEQAQQIVAGERARVSGAVGKLMLASIGAVALAQESLESLLTRMVERGEQLQEDARKRANAFRAKRRHGAGPAMREVETALNVADLPSKADIVSLHNQIAALSAKVDHLSEAKTKP